MRGHTRHPIHARRMSSFMTATRKATPQVALSWIGATGLLPFTWGEALGSQRSAVDPLTQVIISMLPEGLLLKSNGSSIGRIKYHIRSFRGLPTAPHDDISQSLEGRSADSF